MFQSPGDIAFTIGAVDVYYYGIIMACAIFAGIFIILGIKKRFFPEITSESIYDIAFMLIITGIIGARLYYVILDYRYFIENPSEICALRHGGISIHGAVLAGIAAGYLYVKKHKTSFLRYADLFVFGLTGGQILGRWGNFFNSEAFGLPCSLPWKLYIPYNSRPLEYRDYDFFHPAFLYESILNACIFFILYRILSGCKNRKDGVIFFSYLILYSLARILVESIRLDSVLNAGGIHIAHIASFVFLLAGVSGLYSLYGRKSAG